MYVKVQYNYLYLLQYPCRSGKRICFCSNGHRKKNGQHPPMTTNTTPTTTVQWPTSSHDDRDDSDNLSALLLRVADWMLETCDKMDGCNLERKHTTPFQQVDHVTPFQQVDHATPFQQVDHATPFQQVDHVTPFQQVDYATPFQQVDHATPFLVGRLCNSFLDVSYNCSLL